MTDTAAPGPESIVAYLADIFERRGAEEYLGEPVTISEHMLQGATMAEEAGLGDEIVVAALLHDIGHFTSEFDIALNDTVDRQHEEAGARILAPYFPRVVTDCVRFHVAAKRYLCATNPGYFDRLSEASVKSLALQGGPMAPEEVAAFEVNPNRDAIVQVRYLDEAAKRVGMKTPGFAHFAPKVQRLVDRHCKQA